MTTPEDLARDKALCDAANANDLMWSEHEVEFIAAAREYIAEVERLREEVVTLRSFLEVMDSAAVTMNGMKPTEALMELRKIAGAPRIRPRRPDARTSHPRAGGHVASTMPRPAPYPRARLPEEPIHGL